ncbi:MAG: lipase [Sphingomonas bacterium]|nr:lipase [Sphingomonas bacterium]
MPMIGLLSGFLLSVANPVPEPPRPAKPLPVHVGGRVLRASDGSLLFGWPGVYFESRFNGTAVLVAVDSTTEQMRVLVDGQQKALLDKAGRTRLAIRDLPPGDHVVRLEKLTESQAGGGRFLAFYPIVGSTPLPAMKRQRQIEFIGDSYTVGYGNTSPGTTCTKQEVHDRTDTQRAFGPITANRLGADYRVIAYSGRGVVRNYGGDAPDITMPTLYPRVLPDDAAHLVGTEAGWRPQVIVIALGTNDFSTPLHVGERWQTSDALRADFREKYGAFAKGILARQPQASLILLAPAKADADVRRVAANVTAGSTRSVTTLSLGKLALAGCDYHPSLADHRALAAMLQTALGRMPGLWPGQ